MTLNVNQQAAKLAEILPTFLASYAKRFLEKAYDGAFHSQLGQRLLGLSAGKKYGIEFILYALTAFFESRLAENTKLAKFAKEVGLDAAPEISKRLINGAKEEVLASATTDEEKEIARLLAELDDAEFVGLLNWLYEKPVSETRTVLGQLSLLSAEQVARLMRFSPEDREKFFGVLEPRLRPKPEERDRGEGVAKLITDDIRKLRWKFRKEAEQ